MVKILFWTACLFTIFPYVVYPILLRVGRHKSRLSNNSEEGPETPPFVTIIVSARNEEDVIAKKIENALTLDYPADRLEILVISDASTDSTDALVRTMAAGNPSVKLLALQERRGKTAGLNRAMEEVHTELVVFTDANAMFDRSALENLVAPFRQPDIGYVVGAQKYNTSEGQSAGDNEGLYWRFELMLKESESDFYSVVGGDGAIYAIRRELFAPLLDEDINDFVNPLQIILKGYCGVFRSDAIAFEDPANSFVKEFDRKRRIVCRSWGALLRYGLNYRLLQQPKFAFMVVSHKVLRWFSMLWIAIAVSTNLIVLATGPSFIYIATATGIFGSFLLASIGRRLSLKTDKLNAVFAIPYYFYLANIAAILGVYDYARGDRYVVWDHVRSTT